MVARTADWRIGSVPQCAKKGSRSEPLGFDDVLRKPTGMMRGSMDASEYKYVVRGLIFLKYVEDTPEEGRIALHNEFAERLLESRDELAEAIT
jgi:type I restriction-modification system DNA methylase subunit